MPITQEVSSQMFYNTFKEWDRVENFGNAAGLEALYQYLLELSEDIGEDITLDVIDLCCNFMQYNTIEDMLDETGAKSLDELRDNSSAVIEYEDLLSPEYTKWQRKYIVQV